jgi:hypothetical protein
MKSLAIIGEDDAAVILRSHEGEELWLCIIKPFGSKGYEWILEGNDYRLTIGHWLNPKSRPSIMAEIRSETLWRIGPQQAADFLKHILISSGAKALFFKVSRVDLCLDLTLPVDLWTADLVNLRATRANYAAPHFFNADLTGISIGKGAVSARLYDKIKEIARNPKNSGCLMSGGSNHSPIR